MKRPYKGRGKGHRRVRDLGSIKIAARATTLKKEKKNKAFKVDAPSRFPIGSHPGWKWSPSEKARRKAAKRPIDVWSKETWGSGILAPLEKGGGIPNHARGKKKMDWGRTIIGRVWDFEMQFSGMLIEKQNGVVHRSKHGVEGCPVSHQTFLLCYLHYNGD